MMSSSRGNFLNRRSKWVCATFNYKKKAWFFEIRCGGKRSVANARRFLKPSYCFDPDAGAGSERLVKLHSGAIAAGMASSAVKMEARRELFIAAIALRRCKMARGHLPERLVELVPEFLQEEPVDWMDEKPLHYRRNEDDTFQLYSVGEDGMDNGGDPSASDRKSKGVPRMDDGKDMVFPAIFRAKS